MVRIICRHLGDIPAHVLDRTLMQMGVDTKRIIKMTHSSSVLDAIKFVRNRLFHPRTLAIFDLPW